MAINGIFFDARKMTTLEKEYKQINFATAVALTRTAKLIERDLKAEMLRVFDRPTMWTMKGLYGTYATPTNLKAMIQWRQFGGTTAESYLSPQVYGGKREQKRFETALASRAWRGGLPSSSLVVPGRFLQLDPFGNIPRGLLTKIMSRLGVMRDVTANASASRRSKAKRIDSDYFIGKTGGIGSKSPFAIYERRRLGHGSSARPILFFTRKATYKKRFHFFEVGRSTFDDQFDPQFLRAYQEAMRTAR